MKYIKLVALLLAAVLLATSASLTAYAVDLGVEELICGDVNGDGLVNSMDINLIKRYIAGKDVSIILMNADMNLDDVVDSMDSNVIKRLVIGH